MYLCKRENTVSSNYTYEQDYKYRCALFLPYLSESYGWLCHFLIPCVNILKMDRNIIAATFQNVPFHMTIYGCVHMRTHSSPCYGESWGYLFVCIYLYRTVGHILFQLLSLSLFQFKCILFLMSNVLWQLYAWLFEYLCLLIHISCVL